MCQRVVRGPNLVGCNRDILSFRILGGKKLTGPDDTSSKKNPATKHYQKNPVKRSGTKLTHTVEKRNCEMLVVLSSFTQFLELKKKHNF